MSEALEPTIIEYARFHGLVKDHQNINPLTHLLRPALWPTSQEDPDEWANGEALQASSTNEKLAISQEAATLLSSCTTTPKTGAQEYAELLCPRRRAYKQKLEVPVLLTDNELDVQRFVQRIEPELAGFNLPYERIDEENDEGFAWPETYYVNHDKLESRCTGEKIEATRDVFSYLQNALKDGVTDKGERVPFEVEIRHKRVSP